MLYPLSYGRLCQTLYLSAASGPFPPWPPGELTLRAHLPIVQVKGGARRDMARAPFVWEVQIRREVLEDELSKLRELPYSLWREVIASPLRRSVTGRDERPYRLRVTATWAEQGSEFIRVTVTLQSSALHRTLIEESFVITPDNRFLG